MKISLLRLSSLPLSLHVCRPMYFLVISYMQLPNDKAQPENAASKYAHTRTPKVCRRMAFDGYWAVILPTLGGGGGVLGTSGM